MSSLLDSEVEADVEGEASEDELVPPEVPGEFDNLLDPEEQRGEKRPREEDDDEDAEELAAGLEEDDLNVIEEHGVRVRRDTHKKKKLKRLHKVATKDGAPEAMDMKAQLESHLFAADGNYCNI